MTSRKIGRGRTGRLLPSKAFPPGSDGLKWDESFGSDAASPCAQVRTWGRTTADRARQPGLRVRADRLAVMLGLNTTWTMGLSELRRWTVRRRSFVRSFSLSSGNEPDEVKYYLGQTQDQGSSRQTGAMVRIPGAIKLIPMRLRDTLFSDCSHDTASGSYQESCVRLWTMR